MATTDKAVRNDPRCSPEARGKRLRSLRKMTDKSRKEIAEKHGLSAGTLQGWEDGRYGGLTEKGAKKVIKALRTEGIQCSLDWIMYGIGLGPQISERLFIDDDLKRPLFASSFDKFFDGDQDKSIRDELLLFRQNNQETIDMVVTDDCMAPFYQNGDFVAGRRRFGEDIRALVGLDCIVQTKMGETLLRRLRLGPREDIFTLISINTETAVENPTLYNVELMSAAPVVWIRRKDMIGQELAIQAAS